MAEHPLVSASKASNSERRSYIVVGLLLCLAAAVVLVNARSFPATPITTDIGASAFPSVYGWLLILLSVILIAKQFSGSSIKQLLDFSSREAFSFADYQGPLSAVLLCVGYIVAMEYFGYLAATLVFMVLIMKIAGVKRWSINLLLAVVLSITLYLLFSLALNVPLPEGSLLELLRSE